MRVGNYHSGSGKLQDAFDELMRAWQTVRESWSDERALQFEADYLKPIADEVGLVIPAISVLSQSTAAAVRDCDDVSR